MANRGWWLTNLSLVRSSRTAFKDWRSQAKQHRDSAQSADRLFDRVERSDLSQAGISRLMQEHHWLKP
jgi:ferric-dicitrate binding protein FerR (iron transport regulator)